MTLDSPHSLGETEVLATAKPRFELGDTKRLNALSQTHLMDSAAEPAFDRLTALATRLLGAPVSLVSLVDDRRQFFKSQCGLPEPGETPLSHSFCQHVVTRAQPLIVTDARLHPLVRDNLAIRDLNVIAYLGIPLISPDGQPLGSFCAIDGNPRDWSPEDLATMSDLAHAVQSEIGLRLALTEAERAAEERDLMTAELNHRVKNLFAMVSGIIGLTARNSADTADMAKRLRGRITALAEAHALVEPAITGMNPNTARADLRDIARAILAPHDRTGAMRISGPLISVDGTNTARLSLVLHELATNAAKYGALSQSNGSLALNWTVTADTLLIEWIESAIGTQTPTSKGFGSRLIDGTIQQFGGTSERIWDADGLRVKIEIPTERLA